VTCERKAASETFAGRKRLSRKALNTILDQLARWALLGAPVRLVISRGMQLLHIIGRIHESPPIGNDDARDFSLNSLSGEVYVPLLPDLPL
jgi:hypothetical protein